MARPRRQEGLHPTMTNHLMVISIQEKETIVSLPSSNPLDRRF